MKFTTTALSAVAIAAVSASPVTCNSTSSNIQDGDVFNLLTLSVGTGFHNERVQAIHQGLFISAPEQKAICSVSLNYASFYLSQGGLYLYNKDQPQQIFVDRSGMGRGVIQYTTGDQGPSRSGERTGFTINDSGNLVFRDQANQDYGFQACPSPRTGGYSIWLSTYINPGGNTDCVNFDASVLKSEKPTSCFYSTGMWP